MIERASPVYIWFDIHTFEAISQNGKKLLQSFAKSLQKSNFSVDWALLKHGRHINRPNEKMSRYLFIFFGQGNSFTRGNGWENHRLLLLFSYFIRKTQQHLVGKINIKIISIYSASLYLRIICYHSHIRLFIPRAVLFRSPACSAQLLPPPPSHGIVNGW